MYLSGVDGLIVSPVVAPTPPPPSPAPEQQVEEQPPIVSDSCHEGSHSLPLLLPQPHVPQSRASEQSVVPAKKLRKSVTLLDLKGITKMRHIVARVEEAGFIRQKDLGHGGKRGEGSHRVYKHPDGYQVSFPYHSGGAELQVGLRRELEKQAKAPPQHPRGEGKV